MFLTALLFVLAADPKAPTLHVVEAKAVEVRGLPISFSHKTLEEWTASLKVIVVQNDKGTALLGTHTFNDGTIHFEPRFPFSPGVKYRIVFRDGETELTHDFAIPKPKTEPGSVNAILPSGEKLPDNLLRFYVHFTKPMTRGDIYKHIVLTNDTDKKIVEMPFLELEEELWSADRKRLTLLIDPGRIKREVKPLEDLGPVLEAGKKFTLAIANSWHDADGEPLKKTFRKSFTATAAIREALDPMTWTFVAPTSGSRDKLSVSLGSSLDSALLQRLVWIEDATGKKLEGEIVLSKAESVWEFVPKAAWTVGSYKLTIATHLEDVCGNRVGEPFEVDLFKPVGQSIETKTVARTIQVK